MLNLPYYVSLIFVITTILTVAFFYKATKNSTLTLLLIALWLTIQAIIAISDFYLITDTFPPRFIVAILPPILTISILFFTTKGKSYIDKLNVKTLTLLHIIRIPVELVLYWLFIHKAIPELMTFEGRNFDILSGLTAPLIYYFGFIKKKLSTSVILIWNFICLGLLLNIVTNAILSAPLPFQQFAFDQPNVAVLYFPFIWLPSCIVPIVLFSHLAIIRQLLTHEN